MLARAALAAGLVLLALAVGWTLTRSPPVVAWSDYTPLTADILTTDRSGGSACQAPVRLPAHATAVRLSLYGADGPSVSVKVFSGDHLLTSGVRGSGWIGQLPTIPLRSPSRGSADAKICFVLGRPAGLLAVRGSQASGAEALAFGGQQQGPRLRMRVEYLRSGDSSWLSLAPSVARRMGLGRWPAGTWLAAFVGLMAASIVAGAAWLTARALG